MIALMMLAATQGFTILDARAAYADCMQTTTLRLGAGSSEAGDTVVQAARAECRPALQRFASMMPEAQLDPDGDMTELPSVRAVQRDVEGNALAALLERRARHP
jgi:hypothetical protein